MSPAVHVVILGAGDQDRAGSNLAVADVNKDGKLELVIAAPGGDGPNASRSNSGTVYVVDLPKSSP